jgi:hypothetical protein
VKNLIIFLLFVIAGIAGIVWLAEQINQPDPITDTTVSWNSVDILVVESAVTISAQADEYFVIVNTVTWESYPSTLVSKGQFALPEQPLTSGPWVLMHPADTDSTTVSLTVLGDAHLGLQFTPTEAHQSDVIEGLVVLGGLIIAALFWLGDIIKKRLTPVWARWRERGFSATSA